MKNLENVQGDERDVILFSIASSKNDKGILPLNFGPLGPDRGERRLNVAVTRARQQVIIYCSFDPAELRADDTKHLGIKHLKNYLELAQRGTRRVRVDVARTRSSSTGTATSSPPRCAPAGCVATTDLGLSEFKSTWPWRPRRHRTSRSCRGAARRRGRGPRGARSATATGCRSRCSAR